MGLEKSTFVVISVVGQELLAGCYYSAATIVLESSLKIGTTNLKLKGSVLSALSSAYWALNSLEKVSSNRFIQPREKIMHTNMLQHL